MGYLETLQFLNFVTNAIILIIVLFFNKTELRRLRDILSLCLKNGGKNNKEGGD